MYPYTFFLSLQKMIENVFKQQPKYVDDMRSSVPTMVNVFKTLKEKCGLDPASPAAPLTTRGGGGSSTRPRAQHPLDAMTESEIRDVVLYLTDIAFSLHAFLDCYDAAATPLFEADFHLELPSFYESLVPALKESHLKRRWEDPELRDFLREKLTRAHLLLPGVFKQICHAYCVKPILEMASRENMEPTKVANLIECFLQVFKFA